MRLYTYIFLPSISYVIFLLYLLIMVFQNIYLVFLSFLLRLFAFLGFINLLVISLFKCKGLENWVSFHLIIRRVDASVYLFFTIILLCNILFYLLIMMFQNIYLYITIYQCYRHANSCSYSRFNWWWRWYMGNCKRINYKVLSETGDRIEVVKNQEQQETKEVAEILTLLRSISTSEELQHLHQEDSREK